MELAQADFQKLVSILVTLPDFRTEMSRWALIDDVLSGSPRADDIRGLLDLSGNSRAAAVRLIERLKTFGQAEPGKETLGILINKLLDGYLGGSADNDFLRGLFARYPLDVPVADRPPISEWRGKDTSDDVQEKIIGENTLRDVLMLELALEASKAVVRIRTADALGSGFMIASDLVMTNHHVIKSVDEASASVFQFNYQLDRQRHETPVVAVSALASGQFYTNTDLDFTVIQLRDAPGSFTPLKLKGVRVKRDDRVNIIQHPGGHYKKISMQNNFVQYADAKVVQYTTSTEPGSSGSPVFDDQDFDVIAIHHSGGRLLEPSTQLRFLRNEGISMVAVLADLKAHAPEIYAKLKV